MGPGNGSPAIIRELDPRDLGTALLAEIRELNPRDLGTALLAEIRELKPWRRPAGLNQWRAGGLESEAGLGEPQAAASISHECRLG